jgi:predicted dehydrogenase
METSNRRGFFKRAASTTAGAAALAWGTTAPGAVGANERIVMGVVGMSRGRMLARALAGHGVKIAYVCDVDQGRLQAAQREFGAEHAVTDLRRILDDPSVDALAIATPDHWHAPAAIAACNAGKHVYVEKPCSHNIREGRLMIEAARRTGRVIQVGSQSRSTKVLQNGIQRLREGAIGEILVAKAWNSQRRANIGHKQPSDPPPGFDYDLWVGPAPMRPYRANCQHYTWHWWYDFGTGDAGNDGIHELDIARWGLGDPDHPTAVSGHGSKMFFDDDQQFPDTLYVTYEYPDGQGPSGKRLLVYEQRIWSPYVQEGLENGNAFYGTEGCLMLGKIGGWKLYGPRNKLLEQEEGRFSDDDHAADFLDAIRSARKPNADIEVGHRSAVLAHLANLLARTGTRQLVFDPPTEQIVDDPEADALTRRTYREGHWAVPKDA